MKIVCKMTTVLVCCQINSQKDKKGGRRKMNIETETKRKRVAKQHFMSDINAPLAGKAHNNQMHRGFCICSIYSHLDKCV